MLYQHTITIPAATLIEAPYEEEMQLGPGTITRIRVEYPYGCGELAGIQILRGINHLYPVTENEWASWNDGAIESEETSEITGTPFELTIRGVNYDALNPHTLTVAIVVAPFPTAQQKSLLDSIRQYFGV